VLSCFSQWGVSQQVARWRRGVILVKARINLRKSFTFLYLMLGTRVTVVLRGIARTNNTHQPRFLRYGPAEHLIFLCIFYASNTPQHTAQHMMLLLLLLLLLE
jgi:hypothetical protein